MTPLYDVMSAQHHVDGGQIRQNKMKLALAGGKNRHSVINPIAPRHFIQSGGAARLPAEMTRSLMDELLTRTPKAVEETRKSLPSTFPEKIAESISQGVLHRLRKIEQAACGQ